MIYPYAAENRLDAPCAYMYAPYGGRNFLAAYVANRTSWLASHGQDASQSPEAALKDALLEAARTLSSVTPLNTFVLAEWVALRPLLASLLGVLAGHDVAAAQPWLVRVIQRFEVSKKLHATYAPGFRKGEGEARNPARYAELALCLSLAHMLFGQLQYLSTLLKLIDLLLSLDNDMLCASCASGLPALLVTAELGAVLSLADTQGVYIDVE